MKKSFLYLLLLSAFSGYSQDVIIKNSGEEIIAIVKEINVNEIKYKRFDNADGPIISILKQEVFKIKYENGSVEIITQKRVGLSPEVNNSGVHPAQPFGASAAIRPIKLDGPRMGAVYISPGRTADRLEERYNASPLMSVFGWQFETQYFSLPSGTAGVVQFIPVIIGLDQGLFLPSGNLIMGIRGPSGFEVGMGPNLSIAGAGMVFAAGYNLKTSEINFPVNFAVVTSPNGVRYSLTLGFNLRRV
jgi:hypothetical protein